MSWGYKIIIAYAIFIVGMLSMVYVASQQTNEMQDENYYAQELKYQEVIDGKNNLNVFPNKVSISQSEGNLMLKIPTETIANIENGTIYFLRPSDQTKDLHIALKVNEKGEQLIALNALTNGLYTVKISWKSNGKVYFYEQNYSVEK
jgi:nitrogen fixation protein FixH